MQNREDTGKIRNHTLVTRWLRNITESAQICGYFFNYPPLADICRQTISNDPISNWYQINVGYKTK